MNTDKNNNSSDSYWGNEIDNVKLRGQVKPRSSKAAILGAIIFLVAVSVTFFVLVYKDTESKHEQQAINNGMKFILKNDSVTDIEYGSKIDALDFVKDYKGDLTKPKVNTMKLGKQKLIYTLSIDNYKKDYTKWINVQDSQSPKLIIDADLNQTIEQGTPFEFDDTFVKATDPIDGELKPTITGTVDTSKVGVYKIRISATDKNKNRTEKTMTVHVVPSDTNTKRFDVSTGQKLDSWSQYNSNSVIVRGRPIQIVGTVDQNIIQQYVKQINSTPAYLLNMVNQIIIAPQSVMESQYNVSNTDEDTVIGHTQYVEGKTIVILNGSRTDGDDTFIHECAHAYDIQTGISSLKQFKKIYKNEKKNAQKYADASAKEFFAYTYTEYVMKGKDELFKTCPLTADFYVDNNI